MGTYDDSKIVKARKMHKCDKCGASILVGDEYLSYKLGLKWNVAVHLDCAMKAHSGYRCRALEERTAA